MKVLIAVVEDLIDFARTALFGTVTYVPDQEKEVDAFEKKIQVVQHHLSLSEVVPAHTSVETSGNGSFHIGKQYFISSIGVNLYNDPVVAFDNGLMSLQYAQQLRLMKLQGRWAQVQFGDVEGWVFKDALVGAEDEVYPHFQANTLYVADNPETVKLRAVIDDMFGGARAEHSLSPAEYVSYRLKRKYRIIAWGSAHGRIPGTWQRKLRGMLGVHIGIHPKTGSVMEYIVDDIGHLAFVEAVFPDESMKITEIGKYDEPTFSEEILQPEEWKELRPVFIEIG